MTPANILNELRSILVHIIPALLIGLLGFLQAGNAFGDEASEEENPPAEVSYNRHIRPLLSSRCFACHGPDAESRQAGLRLDRPDGEEGAFASAIEPGSADDSEVWSRISSEDEDEIMPPPDSHLKPFNRKEKELIRNWIEAGAKYENHWAFETPVRTPSNETKTGSIDDFVFQTLKSKGLKPARQADPRTLIRRVTFDLTGLPPKLDEINAFLASYETAPESAWESLVDDLLSRPQFGEHFARYWLDVVRFADTNGMHKDFYRNHVEYRDWVIRALNDNLSYADFIKFQLAGDLYENPTKDQLIASGFHRLHLIIDRGTALPEESHYKNVLDRVSAVGTAFMGLTVQCAQCHDHKFDPITQKEFFSLFAFFNNLDAAPETQFRPANGLQQPFVRWPTPEQTETLERLNQQLGKVRTELKDVENQIKKLESEKNGKPNADAAATKDKTNNDTSERQAEELLAKLNKQKKTLSRRQRQLKNQRSSVESTVQSAMVMRERKEIRPTRLRVRGQYDAPGEQVVRGTPAFLPPLETENATATRMDLADWLVDARNPLTARVAVNRFWQSFFGVGLVKTSEDFGNQGTIPSHPELLDELSLDFMESDWNVKKLLKQIVMSRTYRQASHAPPNQFQSDPENQWLARGPRFRLDAEMIRDQILATSGTLSYKMYGRSVKPPQPDGLWKAVSMTNQRFQPDQGEAIRRRSIYTFWKRAIPPPQMTILNAPFRDSCIARRERTNTPSQALLMLNESEYLKAARGLAQQAVKLPPDSRIRFIWETVTARIPDTKEQNVLRSLLVDLSKKYQQQPELASEICQGLELKTASEKTELAAWTLVCSTLYNLDITKTKD